MSIDAARSQLDDGEIGVVLINGQLAPATITETALNNGYLVSTPEFGFVIQAFTEDGTAAPLDSDGRLVVERRGTVRVGGEGFAPESKVRVWAFSQPVLLVDLFTDDAGEFEGVAELPAELTLGVHTVQINGVSPIGDVRSLSFGLSVVPDISDSTAVDESAAETAPSEPIDEDSSQNLPVPASLLIALAGVLALAGALGVVAVRRRRAGDSARK